MIGTIDIKVNASHPNMPLAPVVAFVDSPSSVRIINVPKRIGSWEITGVTLSAALPDLTTATAECVLVGGCWVGTFAASSVPGTSTAGFQVIADGVDENGETVTGYILGCGDIRIISREESIEPGTVVYKGDPGPRGPQGEQGEPGPAGGVASVNGKTGVVSLTGEDIRLNSGEGAIATVADRVNEVDSIATNAANAADEAMTAAGLADEKANDALNGLAGKLDNAGGALQPYPDGTGMSFGRHDLYFSGADGHLYRDDAVRFAEAAEIAVTATTATALKDRDCAVVAYTNGMTLTFAAATNGLRSFEVLITGCEAGGSINIPSVVYRGEADALTLEAGDNHLVFAEYKSGEFFVTRHVAHTITIG